MIIDTLLLLLALGPSLAGRAPDARDALASARELYASAAYEEALATLAGAIPSDRGVAVEVERYRALCLFALGRADDARAAIEKLVEQDPVYRPAEADVPPRMMAMLREVRRAVLPGIARTTYTEARAHLAAKELTEAAPALERVVRIAGDPDLRDVEGMEDLRLLADGFLALAQASAAPATSEPAAPPSPSAASPENGAGPSREAGHGSTIFSGNDADVIPPEAIEQTMPKVAPSPALRTQNGFAGYLGVTIDETGRVESARLLRSIHPLYDSELLRAAGAWRFVPARKDGRPVRYLKIIRIVVKGM